MMRATVGFCAVACIIRPVRVWDRKRCSDSATDTATASTTRLWSEKTVPNIVMLRSSTSAGKGWACEE